MTKRRSHGEGTIKRRGENTWRLRYRIDGRRFSTTFHGSLADARKELRRLLRSGDTGAHVAPDKITLGQWIEQWLAAGAPGRRQRQVGGRALHRYGQLLRTHVVPALGARPLQQVQATEIDALYRKLDGKVAAGTARYVHTVLNSCLSTALRKGMLAANPMARAEKVPYVGEADHGTVLDQDELRTLVEAFRGSVLHPIVCVAAFTGARRGEILALRWADLDVEAKTLRIERAVDHVRGQPLAIKPPKSARGTRTITIDDGLVALLLAEREKHLRLVAGVPDGAAVDLSLVKLPADALMFPNPPGPGEDFSFTKLRNPNGVTTEFQKRARQRGFDIRFHDLRGSHETLLLDAGVPVHVVAARCGHDPAVLLRSYAKRTRKADTSAAAVIGAMAGSVLKR
jgi:integrase